MFKNAVTTIGAAQILGVSLDELFDLIHEGKIPYYKGYHTNLGFMFFESELREWKLNKLVKHSKWIDTALTAALYGNAKPKNISELVSVEVAENYLKHLERQALLK
jgi:hypothetical protein